MARNVIYFGGGADNGNLADIVNLPYTDVIVCFLSPAGSLSPEGDLDVYGNGAAFDANLQANIRGAAKRRQKSIGLIWRELKRHLILRLEFLRPECENVGE